VNREQIKVWAIIPAAGIGKRMNSTIPKQYIQLAGKTILEHSVSKLLASHEVAGAIVGICANDENWNQLKIDHPRFLNSYSGGSERIHTVLNGLQYLQNHASEKDWVLVHDAVRPCVEVEDINKLIKCGLKSESGAILAHKIVDTVKRVNEKEEIQKTLDRNELVLAATPQLFPISLLKKALTQAIEKGKISTDESAAVEALGLNPLIIEGKRTNIKITAAEDLEIAKRIMQL